MKSGRSLLPSLSLFPLSLFPFSFSFSFSFSLSFFSLVFHCAPSLPLSYNHGCSVSLSLSPFFLSLEKRDVLSPCFAARSTVRVSCATSMTLASFVFSFSLSLSSSFSLSFFSLVFHGAPSLSYKPGQLKRSPYGHGRISFFSFSLSLSFFLVRHHVTKLNLVIAKMYEFKNGIYNVVGRR